MKDKIPDKADWTLIYPEPMEDPTPDQRKQEAVILPGEKCTYCGGELELYSTRKKMCKLCERKQ